MDSARARQPDIPEFTLYGEAMPGPDAEFVHIELIETRSRRYDWEIATHLHRGLFQVLFLLEGRVHAQIDDARWEYEGPLAITIPPAVVHGFQFAAETHGFVLTVAESLLFEGEGGATLFEPLLRAPQLLDFSAVTQSSERLESLLGHLMAEFCWPQAGHALMLEWLVRAILLLLLRLHAEDRAASGGAHGEADLFTRFRALVEQHYKEQWSVPQYAAALHVAESRLNRLCRKLAGKTAFDIAQERLMLEARRKLIYVPAPVSLIAYELGFQDPAYFSRVFKRYSGMTPSAFRAHMGQLELGTGLGEGQVRVV
jgi:AraC family transcriptional activator of pobA